MRQKILFALITIMVIASMVLAQQVRQPQRGRLPEGVTALRDIPYVTGGHERQKLDLYLPKAENKLPLIIWIHGGAWLEGSKENPRPIQYLSDGYAWRALIIA